MCTSSHRCLMLRLAIVQCSKNILLTKQPLTFLFCRSDIFAVNAEQQIYYDVRTCKYFKTFSLKSTDGLRRFVHLSMLSKFFQMMIHLPAGNWLVQRQQLLSEKGVCLFLSCMFVFLYFCPLVNVEQIVFRWYIHPGALLVQRQQLLEAKVRSASSTDDNYLHLFQETLTLRVPPKWLTIKP